MKNKREAIRTSKILSAILTIVILFTGMAQCLPVQASKSNYNNDVDKGIAVVLEWATGTIFIIDKDYNVYSQFDYDDWYGQGTGFFVGEKGKDPQYLLTNYHVVSEFVEKGKGVEWEGVLAEYGKNNKGEDLYLYFRGKFSVRVYYSESDYEEVVVLDYLESEADADCAILKLDSPTSKRQPLTLKIPTEEMRGETVYAVGFPGIGENVLTDASKWSMEDSTITKGTISKFVTSSGNRIHRIQVDAEINHGNSGGPLVTAGDGYVIGINTLSLVGEDTSLYYAVNIDHAHALLDKNGIPHDVVKETNGGVMIVIILVVVILVLAAAAILVMKKKKTRKSGTKRGPVASSLAPQHNGLRIAVSTTPILVGRDKTKCAITYTEGTAGVSRLHCSISFDLSEQSFVVTDLGSTYGTFLLNGQRLQANVPCKLKLGDSFYVGDKANIIRLELG